MRVFFIGICGTAMGNAAVLLKRQGFEVAGSDAGVYPPMSDVLADADIEFFEGFEEEALSNWSADRVVVGNAVSRGNPQVEWLLRERSVPFVCLPQLIGEELIGRRPTVVVAGTHGKTTTTSLTAFALCEAGCNPGYLVGGVPLDLPSGSELGDSEAPFVIEGDEYDSAFFDKRSKFIHYRPRILILNNLEFDHSDIFRDLADVSRSFDNLLRIVPSDGYVLLNGDDTNLFDLPDAPWTTMLSVGTGEKNDLCITGFSEGPTGASFKLVWRGCEVGEIDWHLPGEYNARNVAMAALGSALAQAVSSGDEPSLDNPFAALGLPPFDKCRGVKRRQEILVEREGLVVLSDFAHHPTAIAGALVSMRARWPEHRIIACFEPRSNTAVTNVFQDEFTEALAQADEVLIGAIHRAERFADNERLDADAMVQRFREKGLAGKAFSTNEALGEFLDEEEFKPEKKVLVAFFSNGSFDGVIDQVAERFR
uniref:Putative Mur ligase family, catalytic domain protein n=1 Tax=uncultured marine microorganism HF4000_APKG3D20 TaxID=455549 RepID=B3T7B6_9ZZZZ|nr:putative Mur ligase family, catalytic domain protein [uncultured marine microorganism HF4000_APKG3D20]